MSYVLKKWLPYQQPADRRVIVERGKTFARLPTPKNVIIDHEIPHINIEKNVYNEGTHRADPRSYSRLSNNAELKIVDKIYDMPAHTTVVSDQSRPFTPSYYLQKLELVRSKTAVPSELPKTAMGPYNYSGPWNTTYRSSYTGKRLN